MTAASASPPRATSMPVLLVAAVVAVTVVRGIIAATTGLTDDEAYYRIWTLAPALSYLDHPPMAAWMMTLGRAIAGDTAFGLRLPSLVVSLVGPFVLWRTASLLFGTSTAATAVIFTLVMPLLAVGSIIVTPDTPSVLFWGLVAWALAELSVSRNAQWWLAVGLFAGLGLVSKYTNLFVGAGIAAWVLLIPRNRAWLACWQVWAGLAIAVLCTTPVVLWNAQHGWASFAKQFGRVATGQGLTLTYLVEMVGGYMGLASPLIAVLGLIGLARITQEAIRQRDERAILVVSGIAPILLYFILHGLHGRVQANWLAPLYPSMALLAGYQLSMSASRFKRRWLLAATGLGAVLTGLVYLHALRPLVVLPGARDPTSQMRGWPDLAREIEALRRSHGAQWIATESYATNGQLAFQFKNGPPVFQLDERLRYVHLPAADIGLLRSPALVVDLDERAPEGLARTLFRNVQPLARLARSYGGVTLGTYDVLLASDPIAPERLLRFEPGSN